MKYQITITMVLTVSLFLIVSCSGGSNPVNPDTANDLTANTGQSTQTHLWGYYDVCLDFETGEITATQNRTAELSVNVVKFLNNTPGCLMFNLNEIIPGPGYYDVDLDVILTHPFNGLPEFNGYDVRGILIGNGSGNMGYYPADILKYPINGSDQFMMDDPDDGVGGPDGYTRWFNKPEFTSETIFGYYPGQFASPGLNGNANLNPYKYFADGLGATQNLWDFLNSTPDHGVLSSGTTCSRNYYIRFPDPDPGVSFGYAFMANWDGVDIHPANAPESVCWSVTVTDDIYYDSPTEWGGDLILDISLFGWGDLPSDIFIQSTVLHNLYLLNSSEMIPVATGDNWATWHVEIPADNVTGTLWQEFFVIAEYHGHDYTNPMGNLNNAWNDTLVSFFRHDIFVSSGTNLPPEIISGVDGDSEFSPDDVKTYTVTASDPEVDPLTYSWTVTDTGSSLVVFSGPGDGDGAFDVDWASDVGAVVDDVYDIDCDVNDPFNPPVSADTLSVTCVEEGIQTLYLYDGMVDDGGINGGTWSYPGWEYCPDIHAWDEYHCGNYPNGLQTICRTPYIEFPEDGTFTTLHLELWHWGNMDDAGNTYGDVGYAWDNDGYDYGEPNWVTEKLVYIEGMDFNDPAYEDFISTFGSEEEPAWSHFNCNAYAGEEYAIAFSVENWSGSTGGAYAGWNIRKLHIWVEP